VGKFLIAAVKQGRLYEFVEFQLGQNALEPDIYQRDKNCKAALFGKNLLRRTVDIQHVERERVEANDARGEFETQVHCSAWLADYFHEVIGFRVLKIDYLRRTRTLLFATLSCESAFGTGRERQVNPVSAGSKPGYAD
jgi:hypothetical protein